VRLRASEDLHVGPAAVGPVPQQDPLTPRRQRVGQLVDAAVVLAETTARRDDDDLAVVGTHELVDDVPAVDLDLTLGHDTPISVGAHSAVPPGRAHLPQAVTQGPRQGAQWPSSALVSGPHEPGA